MAKSGYLEHTVITMMHLQLHLDNYDCCFQARLKIYQKKARLALISFRLPFTMHVAASYASQAAWLV